MGSVSEFLGTWGANAGALASAVAAALSALIAWRALQALHREAQERRAQERMAIWRELAIQAARIEAYADTLSELAEEARKLNLSNGAAAGTLRSSMTAKTEGEIADLRAYIEEAGRNARSVANAHGDRRTFDADAAALDAVRLEQAHIRLQHRAERLIELRTDFLEQVAQRRAAAMQPRAERKSGYPPPAS
ncbi:hypothetical protein PVT71_12315 [Salipiger sp. H15]|uniref:Uncharacterized protein n=1 Tax=Alloyangia sp. H15 TaxID=3029062 RepID=A0AAU8AET3_9RHOB